MRMFARNASLCLASLVVMATVPFTVVQGQPVFDHKASLEWAATDSNVAFCVYPGQTVMATQRPEVGLLPKVHEGVNSRWLFPRPPKQTEEWQIPDNNLPDSLVSATETLFEQGLADPRGCEYCEIQVRTGNCWNGDDGVAETRGWVLPKGNGDSRRYAVAWSGLVYPVVLLGGSVDLRADVSAALDPHGGRQRSGGYGFRGAPAERIAISHSSILPLKACLLLRLGETELAEQLWKTATKDQRHSQNDEPYLMLARDWTWYLFDRALCAHMRGDDEMALDSARQLVPLRAAVEQEAARRKFKRPSSVNDPDEPMPYVHFLGQIDDVLSDQERRLREGKASDSQSPPLDDKALRTMSVRQLIAQLENVSARQMGQPGAVDIVFDPVVRALVAKGAKSVEPLLDVLENDDRLTRSVGFGRDFARNRYLIGVHAAASTALSEIMQVRSFGMRAWDAEGRKQLAAKMRDYWQTYKDVSIHLRWYRVLNNDKATGDQWLEAAGKIVGPVRTKRADGFFAYDSAKMAGEPLRESMSPSVTELMSKRVDDLTFKGAARTSDDVFVMHDACRIALHLAKWDPEGALPTLRRQGKRCRDYFDKGPRVFGRTRQALASYYSRFAVAAGKAGDEHAIQQFAAWIRTVPPDEVRDFVDDRRDRPGLFRPLVEFSDNPAIQEAAEWIFNHDDSPWNPILEPGKSVAGYRVIDMLRSDLFSVAAFRKQSLRQLQDQRPIGTAVARDKRSIGLDVPGVWRSSGTVPAGSPALPAKDTKTTMRVCDLYAYILSSHQGAPKFSVFWPESKRDQSIEAYTEFVSGAGK